MFSVWEWLFPAFPTSCRNASHLQEKSCSSQHCRPRTTERGRWRSRGTRGGLRGPQGGRTAADGRTASARRSNARNRRLERVKILGGNPLVITGREVNYHAIRFWNMAPPAVHSRWQSAATLVRKFLPAGTTVVVPDDAWLGHVVDGCCLPSRVALDAWRSTHIRIMNAAKGKMVLS